MEDSGLDEKTKRQAEEERRSDPEETRRKRGEGKAKAGEHKRPRKTQGTRTWFFKNTPLKSHFCAFSVEKTLKNSS
jgi:hypothetical protein